MKLVHKATGVEVKIGDEVKAKATPLLFVSGWQHPKSSGGAGRIHVVRDAGLTEEQRMTQGMSFCPDVFGCEWIERADRMDDGDDNGLSFVCASPANRQKIGEPSIPSPSDTIPEHSMVERFGDYLLNRRGDLVIRALIAAGATPVDLFRSKEYVGWARFEYMLGSGNVTEEMHELLLPIES